MAALATVMPAMGIGQMGNIIVSGEETTSTSELEAAGELVTYQPEGVITLNVDKTVEFWNFDVWLADSVTLNFVGENTFSATNNLGLEKGESLAITGDTDAKIYWGTQLTSSTGEFKSVTLASSNGDFACDPFEAPFFEGVKVMLYEDDPVSMTLGGTTADYIGYFNAESMEEAMSYITGDKQIALVAINGSGSGELSQLALVGKITGSPATPEPATATLSLMALAGLCARRRRK